MEALLVTGLGIVTACAVYLLLRRRIFSVILGLSLLSYAVNLFIFLMGRTVTGAPPIVHPGGAVYADPLPQALVLTAIVIGFGMTGFLLELAVRTRHDTGSGDVDTDEPRSAR